jgi:hypothetical protein
LVSIKSLTINSDKQEIIYIVIRVKANTQIPTGMHFTENEEQQ